MKPKIHDNREVLQGIAYKYFDTAHDILSNSTKSNPAPNFTKIPIICKNPREHPVLLYIKINDSTLQPVRLSVLQSFSPSALQFCSP